MAPDARTPATGGDASFVADLAELATQQLLAAGLEQERAAALGEAIAESVRERYQGGVVYVPKGRTLRTMRLWQMVWDDFSGNNHDELRRKYGLSLNQLYRIMRVMRERSGRQGKLFAAEEGQEQ